MCHLVMMFSGIAWVDTLRRPTVECLLMKSTAMAPRALFDTARPLGFVTQISRRSAPANESNTRSNSNVAQRQEDRGGS